MAENGSMGTIKIANEVVAIIASLAASEVEGVRLSVVRTRMVTALFTILRKLSECCAAFSRRLLKSRLS